MTIIYKGIKVHSYTTVSQQQFFNVFLVSYFFCS